MDQATPKLAASDETTAPQDPAIVLAMCTAARSVSTRRAGSSGWVSVQVRFGHNGSRHRQTRLRQTSTAGRPPIGRSRRRTSRRACARASTPQHGQATGDSLIVCTRTCTSPKTSTASSTSTPANPNNTWLISTTVLGPSPR